VEDEELKNIGLKNLRDSLFERMYKRCVENNWTWAFARLSHQGRMHEDIMNFPSQEFYEGYLKILPNDLNNKYQTNSIEYKLAETSNGLEKILCENRMVFLPSEPDLKSSTGKTNLHEANLISKVVEIFQKIYQHNGLEFTKKSLGVITPYRAQIAQIRQALQEKNIETESLSIDTVERYQGGARDIIIISLCTNSVNQLTSLISVSDEGVDRKLNVALTRARKHLVIIGNPKILQTNSIYDSLIQKHQINISES
jgi:DNA replication ATP-dependent helicase Dna2